MKNKLISLALVIVTCILTTDVIYAEETSYDDFIVDSNSTSTYTVNLFDYWIHDTSTSSDWKDPNDPMSSGINNNHLLIFRKRKANVEGDWNLWYKYTPYTGLVSQKLDEDGMPYLTISDELLNATTTLKTRGNESLSYLFNPDYSENTYRNTYENVSGLLLHDDGVGDYYDSTKNYAYYNESSNSFILYNAPGVISTSSGTYSDENYQNKILGQFFPFNSPADIFDIVDNKLQNKDTMQTTDSSASVLNHYFGVTLTSEFKQPQDGLVTVANSEETQDMIFKFTGDDDIWMYIDEYLVVDMGGIHDALSSEINFATGKITITPNYEEAQDETNTKVYYLGEILEQNPNIDEEYLEKNLVKETDENGNITRYTFKDKTTHTFKVFYLERGNTDSGLQMQFFPTINGDTTIEEPSDTQTETETSNPNTNSSLKRSIIALTILLIIVILLITQRKKIIKDEHYQK